LCPTSHRTAIVADLTQLVNYLFGSSANYLFGHSTDVRCHRLIRTTRWSDEARGRPGSEAVGCVVAQALAPLNLLPVPWLQPEDISNALLWLVSDEAQYVTGVALPIDAGAAIK
jgi:NAD(P)-dependent dehydrogenase (short-subunit alcohol dehydrogenase family)